MPVTLLLGARLYTVKTVPPGAPPLDAQTAGVLESDDEMLTLQEGLSARVQADCLLHEATHHMLDEAGIQLEPAVLEAVCNVMGRGVLLLLRDNPEWMFWLAQAARSLRHPPDAHEGGSGHAG